MYPAKSISDTRIGKKIGRKGLLAPFLTKSRSRLYTIHYIQIGEIRCALLPCIHYSLFTITIHEKTNQMLENKTNAATVEVVFFSNK